MARRTTSTTLRAGQAGFPSRPRAGVPRCEECGEADVASYCECCGQELCPCCWGAGDGTLCGDCRGGAWEESARVEEFASGLLVTDDVAGATS